MDWRQDGCQRSLTNRKYTFSSVRQQKVTETLGGFFGRNTLTRVFLVFSMDRILTVEKFSERSNRYRFARRVSESLCCLWAERNKFRTDSRTGWKIVRWPRLVRRRFDLFLCSTISKSLSSSPGVTLTSALAPEEISNEIHEFEDIFTEDVSRCIILELRKIKIEERRKSWRRCNSRRRKKKKTISRVRFSQNWSMTKKR